MRIREDRRVLRPATPDDRIALVLLTLLEDAAWSDAPEVSPEEAGEFLDEHDPGVVFEHDGRVAGYAAVAEGGSAMLLVDPAEDPAPALEALVAWLGEQGHVEIDAYAADAPRIAWLEAHGFAYVRSVFDLGRPGEPAPPAAVWPAGIGVAPFRPGEDDRAVHALVHVDAAWTEVPGHTERSLEGWSSLITAEHRAWVARRDGSPVGWVLGRLFEDGRGWVAQLAVARSARRAGLGRALLLHMLADLRAQGATSFALGVQGANEHAVGLYRDVGFDVVREWRVYSPIAADT